MVLKMITREEKLLDLDPCFATGTNADRVGTETPILESQLRLLSYKRFTLVP